MKKLTVFCAAACLAASAAAQNHPDLHEVLDRQKGRNLIEIPKGTYTLDVRSNGPYKFSKDIAVYNLFSRIGIDEGTDQKTYLNRYNAAIKFLTLVAEGTVSIGTETEDPASAAAGGFKVKSNSRLFTREKMRGM